MRKQERQRWISKIIKENTVTKQEELVELLTRNNIPVTQATISRDIKEMNLIKTLTDEKVSKYSLPQNENSDLVRLKKLLRNGFIHMDCMDNMVVILTKPGSGFALGGLIELVYPKGIFTVMSNDDKILVIMRTEQDAQILQNKMNKILT